MLSVKPSYAKRASGDSAINSVQDDIKFGIQHPLSLVMINLWQYYFNNRVCFFFLLYTIPGFSYSCFIMFLRKHTLLHTHTNIQHKLVKCLFSLFAFLRCSTFSINYKTHNFFCWLLTSSFYSWVHGFHNLFPLFLSWDLFLYGQFLILLFFSFNKVFPKITT